MDETCEELSLLQQAQLYWLYSDLFAQQPERELLETVWTLLSKQRDEIDECAAVLEELQQDEMRLELQKDYVRLVSGVQESTGVIPPYESLYRSDELAQLVLAELSSCYADSGVKQLPGLSGPPDSLAAELRFLAIITFQETEVLAGEKAELSAARRHFIQHHLLQWFPHYHRQVHLHAKTHYYKWLADHVMDLLLLSEPEIA